MKHLIIRVEEDAYDFKNIDDGMSVGQLIEKLQEYDRDAIAVVKLKGRYGSFRDTVYDGWNEYKGFTEVNR